MLDRHELEVFEACKRLLEIHPYLCLCGSGLTDPGECEYHLAVDRAVKALDAVGYAPLWYNRNMAALAANTKENKDANTAEGSRDADLGEEGPVGAPGSVPNCS